MNIAMLALALVLSGSPLSLESSPVPLSEAQIIERELKDSPVLKEICRCESGLRHTKEDGSLVVGIKNSADRGVCQINLSYHQKKLDEMGLDADKLEDNLKYAKYLYQTEGSKPWKWSKSCWEDKI